MPATHRLDDMRLRWLGEEVLVSRGQIRPADFQHAAEAGISIVVNNRPDGETGDALPRQQAEKLACAAGLEYAHIPVTSLADIDRGVIAAADRVYDAGKALVYCRSGRRAACLWAMTQFHAGRMSREEALAALRNGGYDLPALPTARS